jgi:hypothetical protein
VARVASSGDYSCAVGAQRRERAGLESAGLVIPHFCLTGDTAILALMLRPP